MTSPSALSDLLSTLLESRPFYRKGRKDGSIQELCLALLAEESEASGRQLAVSILDIYRELTEPEQIAFFDFLNEELDIDSDVVATLAAQYGVEPTTARFKLLSEATEPRRQELLRRLNQAPGATAELVRMRTNLLKLVRGNPDLGRTDHDFIHLLRSWFNRGFLVLRQITWDSPASILERLIAYEAVHEIQNWDDLRRRLQPADRRCFAFFHPAMPDDPLIFVEVALTKGIPGSIQNVLSENRSELDAEQADTAVFYSISNCQTGLAGISFGNSLIKQVVQDLSHELSGLKTFVTLSPIPGLGRWLDHHNRRDAVTTPTDVTRLAAQYLLEAKRENGKPLDPVARFHLGNGALVQMVHAEADVSDKGLKQSCGAMVNYLYDLNKIAQNVENYGKKNEVAAATAVKTLAKQASKHFALTPSRNN